jgi:hypothetical protein
VGRVLHEQWQWFYQTREGKRGPFDTRGDALTDLDRYKDTMSYVADHRELFPEDVDLDDVTLIELDEPGD